MIREQGHRRTRRVYLSVAAQPDNLGDIAIRQAAVAMLKADGHKLVIFVGSMPRDYVAAFTFPADVELIARSHVFIARYLSDVVRARAHLIFAPGPLQLRPGARAAVKAGVNLMNVLVARLSGGRVIALGRALRGRGAPAFRIERFAIRHYSLFVARDAVSEQVIGRPLDQAPDLAFLRDLDSRRDGRDRLAISLRGDRKINLALLEDIVARAREADLIPVFVTQVGRDDAQHKELAARFGAETVGWDGINHGDQIARVEATYRRCRFVVSDRLHALILGSVKGAAPVALRHPGSDKLSSTLDNLLTVPFIDVNVDRADHLSFASADSDRLAAETLSARARLDDLTERVRLALR